MVRLQVISNFVETADLVTFTGEILDKKLHFLCNVKSFLRTEIVVTQVKLYLVCLQELIWNFTTFLHLRRRFKEGLIVLDFSEISNLDHIQVVVLKNCEAEVLYILAFFSIIYLKKYYFSDNWKCHLCFLCIRMLGRFLSLQSRQSHTKIYLPTRFLCY